MSDHVSWPALRTGVDLDPGFRSGRGATRLGGRAVPASPDASGRRGRRAGSTRARCGPGASNGGTGASSGGLGAFRFGDRAQHIADSPGALGREHGVRQWSDLQEPGVSPHARVRSLSKMVGDQLGRLADDDCRLGIRGQHQRRGAPAGQQAWRTRAHSCRWSAYLCDCWRLDARGPDRTGRDWCVPDHRPRARHRGSGQSPPFSDSTSQRELIGADGAVLARGGQRSVGCDAAGDRRRASTAHARTRRGRARTPTPPRPLAHQYPPYPPRYPRPRPTPPHRPSGQKVWMGLGLTWMTGLAALPATSSAACSVELARLSPQAYVSS